MLVCPKKIVMASSNAGKIREIARLLDELDVEVVPQSEFGVEDALETGASFRENSLIKARHAARETGLPAIADDSGLAVDALDGAPGVHSARYAGIHCDDEANNESCWMRCGALTSVVLHFTVLPHSLSLAESLW